MAFNAKNLTYDKSEPAFLQRLKAGYAAQDGRNNVQHARSGKSRLKMGDGEDDDEPVILDESGTVIEKKVYEGMLKGDHPDSCASGEQEPGTTSSNSNNVGTESFDKQTKEEANGGKQRVAEIGAAKKRKAVKVVGDDADDNNEKAEETHSKGVNSDQPRKTTEDKKSGTVKPKKKVKKIKLSFDDPE